MSFIKCFAKGRSLDGSLLQSQNATMYEALQCVYICNLPYLCFWKLFKSLQKFIFVANHRTEIAADQICIVTSFLQLQASSLHKSNLLVILNVTLLHKLSKLLLHHSNQNDLKVLNMLITYNTSTYIYINVVMYHINIQQTRRYACIYTLHL